MIQRASVCAAVFLFQLLAAGAEPDQPELRRVQSSADASRATIRVHAAERSRYVIPKEITGKFAEHLGWNIYNGMDAQILRNPTFADYSFATGEMSPDGVIKSEANETRIGQELRRQAARFGWPESSLNDLVQARADGLAAFWARAGNPDYVQVSPDTGPYGGRAQRVEVKAADRGIAQWTWLPLHRQREFECEIMVRAPNVQSLTVSLASGDSAETIVAFARFAGVSDRWQTLRGKLQVPATVPEGKAYRLNVTADSPGQFVIRHVFLRPVDHVNGADPDIVRYLRESSLPVLRWPGGNFVSTYHWEDAIGPVEQRPTRTNLAWGGVEPNTFGTDEFIAFCRAVGCEPMICVNAGSGSPAEAARWIEYCNGPTNSPMGRLRQANGHPEPFRVRHWEVGNELWGRWQMNWTTASGYVDRFKQFTAAMLQTDSNIVLYSCGAPAMWGKEWNDTLIAGLGSSLGIITDHPLIGGTVPASVAPLDVYRDFMAVPEVLQQKWTGLRDDLARFGVKPRLAVTELQLFAHLGRASDSNAPVRLTRETLPSQASITEAIYDILVYHAAVRLAPFVEMVTHSAIVNHGGGLRKERERVWANPCHYAQATFALLAQATPVAIDIETAMEDAPMVLPDLKKAARNASFGAIDALAAITPSGELLVSLVHRGSAGPITIKLALDDFPAAPSAELITLSAEHPWDGNSLERPDRIKPAVRTVPVREGKAEFELPPFTVARVRIGRH